MSSSSVVASSTASVFSSSAVASSTAAIVTTAPQSPVAAVYTNLDPTAKGVIVWWDPVTVPYGTVLYNVSYQSTFNGAFTLFGSGTNFTYLDVTPLPTGAYNFSVTVTNVTSGAVSTGVATNVSRTTNSASTIATVDYLVELYGLGYFGNNINIVMDTVLPARPTTVLYPVNGLGAVIADVSGLYRYVIATAYVATTVPITLSYTKAAWVKWTSGGGNFHVIASDQNTNGPGNHDMFLSSAAAITCTNTIFGSGNNGVVDPAVAFTGTWVHIACSYDHAVGTGTFVTYRNGVQTATFAYGTTYQSAWNSANPKGSIAIGGYNNNVGFTTGTNPFSIHHAAVFNRALSVGEIGVLMTI